MKYAPNDKVTLKPNLQVGEVYGSDKFVSEMQEAYKLPYLTIDREYNKKYKAKEISDYNWTEEMIEGLYIPTPSTGQIVKIRKGNYYLVHNDRLLGLGEWTNLRNYDKELVDKTHYNNDFDIVELYEVIEPCCTEDLFNPSKLKLVWKRKEEVISVAEKEEPPTPKYIRITQCSEPNLWYSSKIGKVYKVKEVYKYDSTWYDLGTKDGKLVLVQDCEPATIVVGSKIKVKKYKGQYLYGVGEVYYKELIGKELIVKEILLGIYYEVEESGFGLHKSLVKPV